MVTIAVLFPSPAQTHTTMAQVLGEMLSTQQHICHNFFVTPKVHLHSNRHQCSSPKLRNPHTCGLHQHRSIIIHYSLCHCLPYNAVCLYGPTQDLSLTPLFSKKHGGRGALARELVLTNETESYLSISVFNCQRDK